MIHEYDLNEITSLQSGTWQFVWCRETNQVISPPSIVLEDSFVTTPHVLVIADTLEECDSYIHEHEMTYATQYIVRPDHTLENPTDNYTFINTEEYLANLDIASLPPIEDIVPIAPTELPTELLTV